jgi:hypothetical protein
MLSTFLVHQRQLLRGVTTGMSGQVAKPSH